MTDERLAGGPGVALPLKQFLLLADCPPEWKAYDLYLVRDSGNGAGDEVVFYVGQSQCAFERVWEHLKGAFKGRSTLGLFVLLNWPRSLHFTVELLLSTDERFARVGNDLDAAERCLIEQFAPCFNEALNREPRALPSRYVAPDAKVPHPRSLRRMIVEAEHLVRRERRAGW